MTTSDATPPDINTKATRHVRACLTAAGLDGQVLTLSETSRSAEEAAAAIGVAVGAIVKTLIFTITEHDTGKIWPVAVLVSGDRQCHMKALPDLAAINGKAGRPDAATVKDITGYSIGAVSPIGLDEDITVLIDSSLCRFDRVWASAGHTHLVVGLSFNDLTLLTSGRVTPDLAH
jgi:prolyl-tRNA editing enzyme YbaK/EbsC (Cys-tRNA(Pro) deacylase)